MPEQRSRPAVSPEVLSGDRRTALIAIRDRLAAELDTEGIMPRDVAAVSKQLADVIRELDAMPNTAEVSAVVDINKRRESRRKTAGTQRP